MGLFDDDEQISAPRTADPELVKLLGTRFISRKDVKAEQNKKGEWHPSRERTASGFDGPYIPWSMQDFTDHLNGTRTLGHYVLGLDNTVKFWCFDLDLDATGFYIGDDVPEGADPEDLATIIGLANECNPRDIWAEGKNAPAMAYYTRALRCLAEGLAGRAMRLGAAQSVAIANSGGKGVHVYGFMPEPTPAKDVREIAHDVLAGKNPGVSMFFEQTRGDNFWKAKTTGAYSNITIEVFPKQDELPTDGFGNLLRLPLGVNLKTGNRGYFVNCKSALDKLPEMDAKRALSGDLPWE